MVDNRYRHAGIHLAGPDAGFGRMLLISLGIHLLAAVLFAVGLRPPPRPAPPAYRVDLVSLPVAHPRAGGVAAPAPASPVASRPPAPSPTSVPTKPQPKATVPSKGAKPSVKSAIGKKPAKAPAPSSVDDDYDLVQTRLKIMKMGKEREQRLKAAEAKINQALATEQRQPVSSSAGAAKASGDQLGSAYIDWIKAHLQEYWTLSRYQVRNSNAQALLRLSFDARGRLTGHEFLESSGENIFDESLRNAVSQLKQLPTAPDRPLELTVRFNLKDLPER